MSACSSQLNIWDIGGQKSLRSYWRNYFEATDAMVWVVDSADVWRLEDCKAELHNLLKEERLAGATLLILANKQDQASALSGRQIEEASRTSFFLRMLCKPRIIRTIWLPGCIEAHFSLFKHLSYADQDNKLWTCQKM